MNGIRAVADCVAKALSDSRAPGLSPRCAGSLRLRFHADTLTGSEAREHLDLPCVIPCAGCDEPPLRPVALADYRHKLKLSDPLYRGGRNPQPFALTGRYLHAAEEPEKRPAWAGSGP